MKQIIRFALALGSTLLCFSAAQSGAPNHDHPTTFLGPTLRGGYTSTLNNVTAYSFAGEVAPKNFRVSGTLGWKFAENQRLKVTAEYLWQDITYPFFAGDTKQWVQQGAIGALYQYDFACVAYNPSFDVSAYLSHAPSKRLHTVTGTFVNRAGVTTTFVDNRRIAGSNAAGIAPGVTIRPWLGGAVGLDLNYDNVRYNKNFAPNEDAKGFGGTARFGQALSNNIVVDLSAAVRQPFNNYAASVNWINVPYYGTWALGVGGDYTAGKNTLPSTWNVGISANYFLDTRCPTIVCGGYKGEPVRAISDDLLAWTADPAVYMPQVLAIPDEEVETTVPRGCPFGVPVFSGTIPNGNTGGGGTTVTINTAAFFTGTDRTFTLNPSKAASPGNTFALDPVTGVFTATGAATDAISFTVTATNPCGSATSNTFTVTY